MGQKFKNIGAQFDFRLRAPLSGYLNSFILCHFHIIHANYLIATKSVEGVIKIVNSTI